MNSRDRLPGRWMDLRLSPLRQAAGLGPALGWLAGALASGQPVWSWPSLGYLLLGLPLCGLVWARLWEMPGEAAALARPAWAMGSPRASFPTLPYTEPGSLSAETSAALARAWQRLTHLARLRGDRWVEAGLLGLLLLLAAALWGREALLVLGCGAALLALRWLARGRPAALGLLRLLGGLAWPWWLGHAAWSPLTGSSLLLSMLWGVAYVGWAEVVPEVADDLLGRPREIPVRANERALLWVGLAQGLVLAVLLFLGRPLASGGLALLLLGQVLLQSGLARAGRWDEIARRTWALAAAGMLLSGLVAGEWI